MANQIRTDMYRTYVTLPLELFARVRTAVKGKTVETKVNMKNGKSRMMTRVMMPSDYLTDIAMRELADVNPDKESLEWMADQSTRLVGLREKADEEVAAGKYRKPKSDWKKPGRVAGKKYPKIDAAMKKLGEERREMAAKGIKWRKSSNG